MQPIVLESNQRQTEQAPIFTDPSILQAVAQNCQQHCQMKACRQFLCQQCRLDPSGVTIRQLWENYGSLLADYVCRYEPFRCGPVFCKGDATVTVALAQITGNRGSDGDFFIRDSFGTRAPWDLR